MESRTFLTAAERAWEVMLHSDRQPLSPYLSGRDIYALSICAKRFAPALTQLRHIGRCTLRVLKALAQNKAPHLQHLHLHGLTDPPNTRTCAHTHPSTTDPSRGACQCARAAATCSRHVSMSISTTLDLCVALSAVMAHTRALHTLDVGGLGMACEGVRVLSRALEHTPLLTRLEMKWNKIGPDGAAALASALAHIPLLEELSLWGNREMGPEGVTHITHALHTHAQAHLHTLDLSTCNLRDEGFIAVAHTLPSLTSLRVLRLWNNDAGARGVCAVAQALRDGHTPVLHTLELGRNPQMHTEGLCALARACVGVGCGGEGRLLQRMGLAFCGIGDAEVCAMVGVCAGEGIWGVHTIDMRGHGMGEKGMRALGEWLGRVDGVKRVYLGGQVWERGVRVFVEGWVGELPKAATDEMESLKARHAELKVKVFGDDVDGHEAEPHAGEPSEYASRPPYTYKNHQHHEETEGEDTFDELNERGDLSVDMNSSFSRTRGLTCTTGSTASTTGSNTHTRSPSSLIHTPLHRHRHTHTPSYPTTDGENNNSNSSSDDNDAAETLTPLRLNPVSPRPPTPPPVDLASPTHAPHRHLPPLTTTAHTSTTPLSPMASTYPGLAGTHAAGLLAPKHMRRDGEHSPSGFNVHGVVAGGDSPRWKAAGSTGSPVWGDGDDGGGRGYKYSTDDGPFGGPIDLSQSLSMSASLSLSSSTSGALCGVSSSSLSLSSSATAQQTQRRGSGAFHTYAERKRLGINSMSHTWGAGTTAEQKMGGPAQQIRP